MELLIFERHLRYYLVYIPGPSKVYAPLVTDKKIVCSFYCGQQDYCRGFLFSAALSECILLSAPSVCGTAHILKGYEYYEQESCETIQGILTCTFTDIEIGVTLGNVSF